MPFPTRGRAALAARALAAVALFAAGCDSGPKRKPVFTAEGRLTLNGKPAAEVNVFFHPASDADPDAPRPFATTDADGAFRLTTYDAYDGAPEGEYVVTLLYEPLTSPLFRQKGPKPSVPAKFTAVGTSPLRARIEPRPGNVIPPLAAP